MDLWSETVKYQNIYNNRPESSLEMDQKRRCISLAREGNASKALKSLSQSPIAPLNDSTFNKLKSKHPTADIPQNLPIPTQQEFINFNVHEIIKSFPKSTAESPSGLRIDHK